MNHRNVRIVERKTLSDNRYLLEKVEFQLQRRDGSWQPQIREVYDRGDGATILLYNATRHIPLVAEWVALPLLRLVGSDAIGDALMADATRSRMMSAPSKSSKGSPMPSLSKREQARIERRLASTLTEACETAKAEIVGFVWLTHEVDYAAFPASLRVVWVFDTQDNKAQAIASDQRQRMVELTARALDAADVGIGNVSAQVQFDSEEQCQRANGGNWQQRLARG